MNDTGQEAVAARGSVKDLSVKQEERFARRYKGKRSASSGAAVGDAADVRTNRELIECKHTGTYDKPAKSVSIKLVDLEKIADEAWSESRSPVMGLTIYAPNSVLADRDGFIDMTLRLSSDDEQILHMAGLL